MTIVMMPDFNSRQIGDSSCNICRPVRCEADCVPRAHFISGAVSVPERYTSRDSFVADEYTI